MLPLIREHSDKLEADFQHFYQINYRDRFKPGGGKSELTLNRLICLTSGLEHRTDSLFWSEVSDTTPLSFETLILTDIWSSLAGEAHPIRKSREEIRAEKQKELERLARKRDIKRAAKRRRLMKKGKAIKLSTG